VDRGQQSAGSTRLCHTTRITFGLHDGSDPEGVVEGGRVDVRVNALGIAGAVEYGRGCDVPVRRL
jgi:hypothetical protein